MSQEIKLQDIFIYPIKSLGGIRLDSWVVEEKGFKYDRRWMLIDENGQFLSQRKYPCLAFLKVELREGSILVFDSKQLRNQLEIPFGTEGSDELVVTVWDDEMTARSVSKEADKWFSDFLGFSVRLVKMPEYTKRKVDPRYAVNSESVSFADGMPYLLISQASLDDLNSRLDEPISMNRFRPNLVFSGMKPYQEDQFVKMKVGEVNFQGIKLCARCVMTTIDQESGEKGKEPLKTLATYRQQGHKILFGQNVVALNLGEVKVGDKVTIH